MSRLDIGEALGEGFRLVGRRPLDPLVWGLTYFVLGFLPVLLLICWMAGDYIAFVHSIMNGGAANMAFPQQPFVMQMKMQAAQPLMFVASLVGRSVVFAAIFRAVLTPKDRGFFYVRFSQAEFWLGLVVLVQAVCAWLTMVGLMILAMVFWIPTFVAVAHHALSGWEIPLGVLGAIAALVVFVWLWVRFSMAAPMSFAAREFRLFESWSLTRGRALGLTGLYIVVGLVVICIGLVVECVIAGIGFATLANMGWTEETVKAFFAQPTDVIIGSILPYVLGVALIGSLVQGFFLALFLGPWARAYAQLSGEPAAQAEPIPDPA